MALYILKPGLQPLNKVEFDDEQKQAIIRRALDTSDGKVFDGRRVLVVDPLPQGALPVYDRDYDCSLVVIKDNKQIFGESFTIPTRSYYEGQIEEWLKERK